MSGQEVDRHQGRAERGVNGPPITRQAPCKRMRLRNFFGGLWGESLSVLLGPNFR